MDFSFSPEEIELHERARAFARSRLGPNARGEGPRSAFRALGELGLFALPVPTGRGGAGAEAVTVARVMEGLGETCPDMGVLFAAGAHAFACLVPVAAGAGALVEREILPALISGERIGANAITEAEAGSDVFAMRTRAVRDGDEWVLDGTKSFVTNAPYADELLVYAMTDPDGGFLGVSAFLVPRGARGLTIGAPFTKMGLATAETAPIYLDGCRVPAFRMIGSEGGGERLFQTSMLWERTCLLAAWLGSMTAELDACVAHARGRKQFGRPIGKNQAVSHRIADMKARLEGARLLLYRACWALAHGRDATMDIAVAKLVVSEAALRSSLDAIAIHGATGYVADAGIERRLRDAVPTTIFSGTSDIQRELIATRLGL